MNLRSAVSFINKNGILLVFPIKNQKEPASLWSQFFPRKKMRWEWDDSADSGVANLWMLMKKLSDCRQVVYSKWYQGRATFFSRELFGAMLRVLQENPGWNSFGAGPAHLLEILEGNSPLSTKELKLEADLVGKLNEPFYNRSLKPLFARLQVVAFGEVDDGSFPSLCMGSTQLLFEDVWNDAQKMKLIEAQKLVDRYMPEGTAFRKYFKKVCADALSADSVRSTSVRI